jgi:hypothetical protein
MQPAWKNDEEGFRDSLQSNFTERRDAVLDGYEGPHSNEFMLLAKCTAEEAIAAFRAHFVKPGDLVEITGVSPATISGMGRRQNVWLPVRSSLGLALKEIRGENGKLREKVELRDIEIRRLNEQLKNYFDAELNRCRWWQFWRWL